MPSDYIDNKVRSITEAFLEEQVLPTITDKDNLLELEIF